MLLMTSRLTSSQRFLDFIFFLLQRIKIDRLENFGSKKWLGHLLVEG
jgi:hypothetical protein